MSHELASLEAEEKEYKSQLETIQAGLLADPDNQEFKDLKAELEEVITLTASAIAELKPASVAAPSKASARQAPKEPEKWSKEKHPAYQAGYRPPNAAATPASPTVEDEKQQTTFAVNDNVMAKWKSGDRGFYPARITSITGSSTNPVYIVTFKSYATTETLSAHEIRPLSNSNPNKRKDPPASSAPTAADPTANQNSGVISKGANIDESLVSQTKREPSKVSDGPVRPPKIPRKVKANRELEAGKNKWQQFSAGGSKKFKNPAGKKDSMFRTGEGVNARVGFTGSGHEMRKDEARKRHVYDYAEGDDEY